MKALLVRPARCVRGQLEFPGDKSIAHRAIILSAISASKTIIRNFPANEDCLSTIHAFQKLGVKIKEHNHRVEVFGMGLQGLKKPESPIFVGNSGTTLRLLLGVLAGQDFQAVLKAGKSLSRRPMLRVTAPLRMMGAQIKAKTKKQKAKIEEYPPITIRGGRLKPIVYKMPVASAQVKSAILLAGLYAEGKTRVIEPVKSRDHTERMLKLFKAGVQVKGSTILINADKMLVSPGKILIPGDISSAAFFIVLGLVCQDSRILLKNVGVNLSRAGMIKALKKMGGRIKVTYIKCRVPGAEPAADILVEYSKLKGARIKRSEVPGLIDELPVLMVAACLAKGKTVFEGVKELRVKETDRIKSMVGNLKKMGARIRLEQSAGRENIVISGTKSLKGAALKSFGDHRTAMSMVIAGLAAAGSTRIDDIDCVKKSFPGFLTTLKTVVKPKLA
jgi:3-phosphoshikimate 1-carboxyvinyltransferase